MDLIYIQHLSWIMLELSCSEEYISARVTQPTVAPCSRVSQLTGLLMFPGSGHQLQAHLLSRPAVNTENIPKKQGNPHPNKQVNNE